MTETTDDPNPWLWYHGDHEDAECWYGGEISRENAIIAGQDWGYEHPFCVMEARFAEPAALCFDAGLLLEEFADANEECWDEDGFEGLRGTGEEVRAAEAELERVMDEAFSAWLKKHRRLIPVWSLEYQRNHETISETTHD